MRHPISAKLITSLILTTALFACSGDDSDEFDKNYVEIQAHLSLADVYKNQGQFRASVIETQNAFELDQTNADTLAFIAELYIEIGDMTLAQEQLDSALRILPDSTKLKLLLANTYLATNEIQPGMNLIQDLQVSGEELVTKHWLMGSFLAARSNNSAAMESFKSALALNSAHIPTLISLSKLSFLNGDNAQAEEYVRQAINNADTNDEDLWIWRGQLAMLEEDYPAAEEAFFEALDIMALYDIMTAKRYSTLQSILVPLQMQQKNDEALRYSQIIAATPQGEFESAYANVISLFQQGDMAQAEAELSNLLTTAPNHPGGNILMGLARYSEGNFEEAASILSEYVDESTASTQLINTLAATHLRLNQPEKALSVLQQALVNNPEDSTLMSLTGIIQRGLGNLDESESILREALALDPQSPQIYVALAGTLVEKEDFDGAISQLETSLEVDPEFSQSKSALLEIYNSRTDTDSINKLITSWLQDAPDSVFNNMAAAAFALTKEQYVEARTYLNKVRKIAPENQQALLYLARVDITEEKYSDAAEKFNEALKQSVNNADALSGLLAIGDLTGSAQASISRIEQIIESNPAEFLPAMVLSQYYMVKDNLDRAYVYATRAFDTQNNQYTVNMLTDVGNRRAAQAIQQSEFERAREALVQVEAINPNNVTMLSLFAGLDAQAGDYNAAQAHIEKIRELQPEVGYSHELEGDLKRSQDNINGALNSYRSAWELGHTSGLGLKIYQSLIATSQAVPGSQFLDEWMASDPEETAPKILRAMELQGQNKNPEAKTLYEEVYKKDGNNLIVLNNLAWMYQDDQPERALELAGRAAELYPENADVLDTYGWILYKQNNRELGLSMLERALELAPESASIKEHVDTIRSN